MTALAFNTVFHIPPDEGMFTQILGVTIIYGAILWLIEVARDWEERRRKSVKSKTVFKMEEMLRNEYSEYIKNRNLPRNETMELCVKVFMAVCDYKEALKKKRSAGLAPKRTLNSLAHP